MARELRTLTGRVKPLIGLPLVGTGEGGFRHKRGLLIRTLLPVLSRVARDSDVDVALVLKADRDHVATQGQRCAEDWEALDPEQLAVADDLGARAARRELSLFLGSGVSVPLGLPDWKTLLEDLGGQTLAHFTPTNAPAIAQLLSDQLGRVKFNTEVAQRVRVSGYAPAHLLLAALGVQQTVTTNYDQAYEAALDAALGSNAYQVLTRQLAVQPKPWVLNHGDISRPETIVISESDYYLLESEHRSLLALVESLLMTSHLMFVGFSMGDRDFIEAARRVHEVRALADQESDQPLATVLALHPESVLSPAEFETVAMTRQSSDEEAARQLEIFLDRMAWATARQGARSNAYLLDENYADLFVDDTETLSLRETLAALTHLADDHPARQSRGWTQVQRMLLELGVKPSTIASAQEDPDGPR